MTLENERLGAKPRLEWVPVEKIRVDHNYQRELRPKRVAQILKEFCWRKFGALMLNEHPDGMLTVYDGQHRAEAARQHSRVSEVPATIVAVESMAEEAEAFLGVNINRSAVTPVERYWAGLEAGDQIALRVRDVLASASCEVVQAAGCDGHNKTNAVTAVTRAINTYGDASVGFACRVLSQGWSSDSKALKGTVIVAIARLHRNNNHVDEKRMLKMLEQNDRNCVSGNAEALRKISGGDAPTAIAKTICELYNKGLQKGHIHIGARP
ncbi:MAG: hypothetical protein JJ856_13695 [Roseibium sp.]|uniref:DUF6551 family protein n=1 Tax=Roseibium sp. TaxID=1936156 RepID=UPI001AFDB349|nr:DUF6551 family protein [Roseibium sp.]MBO6930621.1 hypothetical protein [Roseibium sp.]